MAIGDFNIADLVLLKAVVAAAQEGERHGNLEAVGVMRRLFSTETPSPKNLSPLPLFIHHNIVENVHEAAVHAN